MANIPTEDVVVGALVAALRSAVGVWRPVQPIDHVPNRVGNASAATPPVAAKAATAAATSVIASVPFEAVALSTASLPPRQTQREQQQATRPGPQHKQEGFAKGLALCNRLDFRSVVTSTVTLACFPLLSLMQHY
jgi:hypothetical protein